jgi:hypothetical protein
MLALVVIGFVVMVLQYIGAAISKAFKAPFKAG